MDAISALSTLQHYCEKEHYKGWDPYDGLNSLVFRSLPGLKHSAICRLVVIQGFKRFPINLRRLALVKKDYNPKGIALLLNGYCNLLELVKDVPERASAFGNEASLLHKIHHLADLLISLQSHGDYHGACWGYNFDWQARRVFFFPRYTPTVVVTSFATDALFHAYELTREQRYLEVGLTAADFVLHDLARTPYGGGYLFSYSPIKGNDTVFNASLLGSKLLAHVYYYTQKTEYLNAARASVIACCAGQQENGAWIYGMLPVQSWVDSFHTGYNLDALTSYERFTGDHQFHSYISRGLGYYLKNFFEQDGCPKYYDKKKYPIDIHCPAQLFVTLSVLDEMKNNWQLAEKVFGWTMANMRHERKGYFYYQLKQGLSSKISYMRWSNAFMFYALSHYVKATPTT